jgi:hypothetical protein
MGGFCRATWDRLRALGLKAWSRRTTLAGYLGIIGGSVQMGIEGREHLGMIILGASVAAIGHFNARQAARGEPQ